MGRTCRTLAREWIRPRPDLPDDSAPAASDAAETANNVIEDIADGPDDENG